MKQRFFVLLILSVLSAGFVFGEDVQPGAEAEISLPWQEFKDLLRLDENQIVLSVQTYNRLLAQTGGTIDPKHTVQDANVILTRAEFDKLTQAMKPPVDADVKPPFEYLITKAAYQGTMQEEATVFTGFFTVHVLKPEGYVRVPILPQQMALESMTVHGKSALVIQEGGYHAALLNGPDHYEIQVRFTLKSSLDKGPHRMDFNIQRTPITLLDLDVPLKDIEVEIPQAQQVQIHPDQKKTRIQAILASGNSISIRWRKQTAAAEKVPSKLYAEMHHLVSIEDDALKVQSEIILDILHSEIDRVQLILPEALNILSVTGEGVGEWQETDSQSQRLLDVPFTYSKEGKMSISMVTEQPFAEQGLVTFQGIQMLNSVRETGYLGIELNTSAEVKPEDVQGVEKIPVQKLPQRLINQSNKPLMLAFKYLKHPYQIALKVEKHEKIAVPVATIQTANAVTLFTEDGKIVHRMVYQVRNSAKQFLSLKLPSNADVWSVFVGNDPVESSMNGEGRLLVPLIRSKSVNNRLDTFPVEIIFCLVQEPFRRAGAVDVTMPEIDLLVSQILWSVYLPNDYEYYHFRSTLEKEEIIRGIPLLNRPKRLYDNEAKRELLGRGRGVSDKEAPAPEALEEVYMSKQYKSSFRNVPVDEGQMMSQMMNEMEFDDRMEDLAAQSSSSATGVLPIQIKIPTGGQVYRFAKTIIQPDDPLQVKVSYLRLSIVSGIQWTLIIMLIVVLFLIRRIWIRGLKWIVSMIQKYQPGLKSAWKWRLSPVILFGLILICLTVSLRLSLICFVVFCVMVIDRYLKRRDKKKK